MRYIYHNQGIVIINVLGFAVAMACCILIFLYMSDEHAYDRHYANTDRIYRVALDRVYPERNVMWASIPPGVRDGLVAELPEVEAATRISRMRQPVSTERIKTFNEPVIAVDPTFFKVFSHQFIHGDAATALLEPASVVITKRAAEKYFMTTDVVGKSLTIDNVGLFNVSGVIADLPETSHIHYDFIVGSAWDNFTDFNVWNNNFGYYTYMLLNKSMPLEVIDEKLAAMSQKYLAQSEGDATYKKWRAEGNDYRFFAQPLLDIHLHSNLKWEAETNGSAAYVGIFMAVGILVLTMAIINFVNLATARYSVRAKEVGIRKVLGSLRVQLIAQFMLESLVLCAIAIAIALIITELSLPSLNAMLQRQLRLEYFSNPWVIPSLICTAVVVGLLSGIYPSLMLSSFKPAAVLRANAVMGTRSLFRNRLVVFQFVISFVLVAGTWIVFSQLRYMQSKDLGMTKDNILVVDNARLLKNREVFKNSLMQEKNVVSVAASGDIPGSINGAGTFRPKGFRNEQELNMAIIGIDTSILKTWGLALTSGRDFVVGDYSDTARNVILNETAVKQFGWSDDPIGKEILNGANNIHHVIGVVKDFHLETLHKEIRPLIILPSSNWINKISIRLSHGDPTPVIAATEKLWKEMVPDRPFEYFFLDDHYNSLYRSEQTTSKLFMILTSMAILIASLGLLGLSAFMAERRTKEIGIRKVVGASTAGIVWLLIEDLSKLVMIAILIGIPLTSLAMTSWLDNFAYRMNISFIPYLVAGVLSILIAIGTMLYHATKAASTNPVNSLRSQ
ncbi:MAG: ABC transporter permease [Bacteroidota bacterium]